MPPALPLQSVSTLHHKGSLTFPSFLSIHLLQLHSTLLVLQLHSTLLVLQLLLYLLAVLGATFIDGINLASYQ